MGPGCSRAAAHSHGNNLPAGRGGGAAFPPFPPFPPLCPCELRFFFFSCMKQLVIAVHYWHVQNLGLFGFDHFVFGLQLIMSLWCDKLETAPLHRPGHSPSLVRLFWLVLAPQRSGTPDDHHIFDTRRAVPHRIPFPQLFQSSSSFSPKVQNNVTSN